MALFDQSATVFNNLYRLSYCLLKFLHELPRHKKRLLQFVRRIHNYAEAPLYLELTN